MSTRLKSSYEPRETLGSMVVQGIGLNLTGLLLLGGTGLILGPLGWTGTGVAVALKLIGDSHLIRAYWLWQSQTLPSRVPNSHHCHIFISQDQGVERANVSRSICAEASL